MSTKGSSRVPTGWLPHLAPSTGDSATSSSNRALEEPSQPPGRAPCATGDGHMRGGVGNWGTEPHDGEHVANIRILLDAPQGRRSGSQCAPHPPQGRAGAEVGQQGYSSPLPHGTGGVSGPRWPGHHLSRAENTCTKQCIAPREVDCGDLHPPLPVHSPIGSSSGSSSPPPAARAVSSSEPPRRHTACTLCSPGQNGQGTCARECEVQGGQGHACA